MGRLLVTDCMSHALCTGFITFRPKIFVERNIFDSVVGVFFLFLPVTRRVEVCKVVGAPVRKPEVEGSNTAIDHIFLRLSRYSLTFFYFSTAKIMVFFQINLGFFGKWAFFLENYPYSNVTETNCSCSIKFKKLRQIFVFSRKNRKKVYKS